MRKDEFYMQRALELARKGWGRTNPNPLVGAVIVKNDEIIAEGYHEILGCAHAEVAAFNNAIKDVHEGTLYVNLEPCSHYGRTPPCAKAIIEAGIRKVVVSMVDPNPKVAGRGIQMLRQAGIEVVTGVLSQEAQELNEIFIKYITAKRPFLILKSAMTLDGKIAAANGDSRWVSCEASRAYVHKIRDRVAAIMVGIGTVLKDDPSLTTRLTDKKGKDPVRIIVDSQGSIPMHSKVINQESDAITILATTPQISMKKERQLEEKGIKLIKAEGQDGRVDLCRLVDALYQMEIDSALLEGGGTLNFSALEAGIVDKVMFFISPKILGGKDAMTPVEGTGRKWMKDCIQLSDMKMKRLGEDMMVEGRVRQLTIDN